MVPKRYESIPTRAQTRGSVSDMGRSPSVSLGMRSETPVSSTPLTHEGSSETISSSAPGIATATWCSITSRTRSYGNERYALVRNAKRKKSG